jgi:RP/EB family microtubule-associated protein
MPHHTIKMNFTFYFLYVRRKQFGQSTSEQFELHSAEATFSAPWNPLTSPHFLSCMAKPLGMMSGCYFVGRVELLSWVNNLLRIDYDKIEDTANGAAFCQIIDALHPGSVVLGRVNYDAITEADMIENYKILQNAFDKLAITRYIDVSTLCKGRYMAALEFFQWIHGYFEQMGGSPDYDGVDRRKRAKCKEPTGRGRRDTKPAGMAKRGAKLAQTTSLKTKPVDAKPMTARRVEPLRRNPVRVQSGIGTQRRITKLEVDVEQIVQERDFYYGKLRHIEDFCQANEDSPRLKQILEILYEADPKRGFLPPQPDDERVREFEDLE